MKKIFSSRKLLIMLTMMIFSLSVMKVVLDSVSESILASSAEMQRRSSQSSIKKINVKIADLEKSMAAIQPPYMSKQEATRFLTETAENIRTMYNGKYISNIKDESSRISIDLEFTIEPDNPSIAGQITDYFEKSTAPVFYINKLGFENKQGIRTVSFKITVSQPYYGGSYEY